MDESNVDAATTWKPLPGSILFGLLLLIAASFVLVPSEANSPLLDRWTRISPFACLYDILQRIVEIGFVVYDRCCTAPATHDPSVDILVRLRTRSTYRDLALRLAATISLLALLRLHHAIWTQYFAVIYIAHWATTCIVSVHSTMPLDRAAVVERVSGAIFAVTGHLIVRTTTAQPSPSSTWHEQLADTGAICLIAGLGAFFAHGFDRDHSVAALVCQPCALGWWAFVWLLALGPATSVRQPLPDDATEWDRIACWSHHAAFFHMGTICFLISHRSLGLAQPTVKITVGAVSLGFGVFYYCYFYYVYSAFGGFLAERPSPWVRFY